MSFILQSFPMNAQLKVRPIRDDDEPFLRDLRAAVDVQRLGLAQWRTDEESRDLAKKIIDLQHAAHGAHFKKVKNKWDTRDCVVEMNDQPVGRFILMQDEETVRLGEIAVHPAFQGQGIGQAVVVSIQRECEQSKRILHLHVEKTNPAIQFYVSCGFRIIDDLSLHYMMEWVPTSLQNKTLVFSPVQK